MKGGEEGLPGDGGDGQSEGGAVVGIAHQDTVRRGCHLSAGGERSVAMAEPERQLVGDRSDRDAVRGANELAEALQ